MTTITDDYMKSMLVLAKVYSIVLLKAGPRQPAPGMDPTVWEHARRNFQLRADGQLAIVCPVSDSSDLRGVGIFNTSEEETRKIMEDDPGVKAGIFTFEIHSCRSFPGDSLPK